MNPVALDTYHEPPTATYHGEDELNQQRTLRQWSTEAGAESKVYCPGRKCFNEEINIPSGQAERGLRNWPAVPGFSNVDITGDLDKGIVGGVMK